MEITPFMPMGVFGILREAFKIPSRNGKIFLSITLFLLIPSSLIFLANDFTIKPLVMDLVVKTYKLEANDPQWPGYSKLIDGIRKDVGFLVGEETLLLVISSIVSLFTAVATIFASSMTYYCKDLTHNELFLRIGQTWKRPMITWLYITLFESGYLLLIFLLVGIFTMIAKGSMTLACLTLVLALLLVRFYVYFSMLCKLGIVISVMEEDNYGMGALTKAADLIEGRKRQGYILYVLFKLVGLAVYWVLSSAMQDIDRSHTTRLVIGVVLMHVISLEKILMSMVFTVFYFECKKSHGEKVETGGESGYSLVSTTALVEV
ncbi:uncharacterized protein LOC131256447 [Magnolia sinica]|uniref:uncharacterized protein LOC131256447 n=1 Tax=Magnolia sinica TaxID=86752 RepID=UPI002657F743|nr:uncharacterized protein LOC131256447 [Magnolia sinica]